MTLVAFDGAGKEVAAASSAGRHRPSPTFARRAGPDPPAGDPRVPAAGAGSRRHDRAAPRRQSARCRGRRGRLHRPARLPRLLAASARATAAARRRAASKAGASSGCCPTTSTSCADDARHRRPPVDAGGVRGRRRVRLRPHEGPAGPERRRARRRGDRALRSRRLRRWARGPVTARSRSRWRSRRAFTSRAAAVRPPGTPPEHTVLLRMQLLVTPSRPAGGHGVHGDGRRLDRSHRGPGAAASRRGAHSWHPVTSWRRPPSAMVTPTRSRRGWR